MPEPKSLEARAQDVAQQTQHSNADLLEEALLRVLAYGFRGGNNQENMSRVVKELESELELVREVTRFGTTLYQEAQTGNVRRNRMLERIYLSGVD